VSLDDPRLYEGTETKEDRAARRALLERLTHAGVSEARLRQAIDEQRLAVLPAELALGGETPYTLTAVAKEVGIDPRFLRQLLLALGRPSPRRGERAFTDADVDEARILKAFLDAGLPRQGVLHVARVLGQGLSSAAFAVRELVATTFLKPGDSEHELALRYEQAASGLAPLVGPLLGHELLVHIRELVRRDAVSAAEREAGTISGTRTVAVGFGDLVDFTKLGGEVGPEQLGGIADRLSAVAGGICVSPVQLVKTIGDAVMLVSPDVPPLLEALCELMEKLKGEAADFPELRAGVAYGPAVASGGDWFGAPVNLASRLTAVAKPGSVIVDECTKAEVEEHYEWGRSKRKALKGIGRTKYYRLPRAGDS